MAANPSTRTFFSVFASNSDKICSAYWTDINRNYVEISGCGKDETIVVSFMSRLLADDNIIGGKEILHYLIVCKDISPKGVYQTVVNFVTLPMFAEEIEDITPSFSIITKIYNDLNMRKEVQKAVVGTKLYWLIQGPVLERLHRHDTEFCLQSSAKEFEDYSRIQHFRLITEYNIIPINCTAFPGTVPGRIFQTIIIDGCTMDDKLVENFRGLGPGKVATDLYAFRFYNSPILTLQCTVRVCPIWSDFCESPCIARRKRSVIIGNGAYEKEETINTQLSILTENNNGVSSNISLSGLSFIPVISILLQKVVFVVLFLQP
ncbi:hypothetical protein CHS0354_012096 [Potamilus streckersoni]|uniref:ZP domain-containing protein n=1 Tax=Potamilus streckersoni TaxID=2493646 RepID=A0AAE0S9U7_9BIVA|nr:hypothetical protein CHS0354_012096 [Potamilus streckersoni]